MWLKSAAARHLVQPSLNAFGLLFQFVVIGISGLSFKYRPPAKLLVFNAADLPEMCHIMALSSRFGGLCTALEKLLRSVQLLIADS